MSDGDDIIGCWPFCDGICAIIAFSLCRRSSCSGVMHLTGGGIGASGELRPISLGLGSSFWIGGRTGAPETLPEVIGRGDCLVGLMPDNGLP